MGRVDLVFDELVGRRVARKRIRSPSPRALARFKLEFRAVEDLDHPNVVKVHELGEDEDGLYFTMDAVDGENLDAFSARVGAERAVSVVLPQLLDALAFLHRSGVIHRDLKPTNVLVSFDEAVRVVDFGVLSELGERRDDRTVAGTPGYMAPEQIRGETPSTASDLYAVGCIIFEIVSGRPVFDGTRSSVLAAHLNEEPPRLRSMVPDVEQKLDDICASLLKKNPEARPSLEEVLDRLGIVRRHDRVGRGQESLRGRAELQALITDRMGARRLLTLEGASGVGKSALLDWLAVEEQRRGRIVLRGRSRPSERVAFNALDAAVDDLSRWLRDNPSVADGLRSAMRGASTAFPVLRGGTEAERVREAVRASLFGAISAEPSDSRQVVFDSMVALLDAAAKTQGGALLAIDDFQWADDDSIALLDHCLDRTTGDVRVVVVLRNDVPGNSTSAWLAKRRDGESVQIPVLAPEDIATLVRDSASKCGAEPNDDAIRAAVIAAAGRPFLAQVLGHALSLGDDIRDADAPLVPILRRVSVPERRLLALITAADDWTKLERLSNLSGLPRAQVVDAARSLARAGLVRRGEGADIQSTIDLFHDGVRTALLNALEAVEHRNAHAAFADDLSRQADAPAERLVRHLLGAGREEDAARHARIAAVAAERHRAFGLAADMYTVALRHPGADTESLREARGTAYERAGSYDRAAGDFCALAQTADRERRTDLLLREAHALIAANRTASGLDRLDGVLAEIGADTTRSLGVGALLAAARFAMGPVQKQGAAPAHSPAGVSRAQRDVKIGLLLSFLEPLTGLSFLQRAQREFIRAGAEEMAGCCDYMFAILALIGSRHVDRVPLAERYRSAADTRVRGLARSPEVRGMPLFIDGLAALRRGDWDRSKERLEAAAAVFSESNGTTERMMALSWGMMSDVYRQDLGAMKRHHEWFRRHVSDCGGTFIVAHVALLGGYIEVLDGAFIEAKRTLTALADMFDDGRPNTQRAAALLYRHISDIYLTPPDARRDFHVALRRAFRFQFLSSMYAGPFAQIGAMLEANALRTGDRSAHERRVLRFARVLDDAPPLVAGASFRARAYAADAMGRPDEAVLLLERAEREADRYGRTIDSAIARYQRGRRLGGDEGRLLQDGAHLEIERVGAGPALLEEDAGLR